MEGLESVRGGNRGTDGFDGGGGRNTFIRSTVGFPGERPEIWVVSLIASELGPVSGCSAARFLLLDELELGDVGCIDTSQWLRSEEGAFLFALAGLELPCVCCALMDAAAARTSPLYCTRVSSRTSCPGCGTVSRLVTIAISVSVSASFIVTCSDEGRCRVEEKKGRVWGSAIGKSFASTTPRLCQMGKLEPLVATPNSSCRVVAKLVSVCLSLMN